MGELKLEHLLEDLRDDGRADSSGVFTLDSSKAEEKLRDFQFASPYHYILKLVQSGVAGGAPRVDVKTSAGRVEVCFGGEPLLAEEMGGLMRYLLNDQVGLEGRRLRHLAAGLRGAVGVKPWQIKFEVHNGEQSFRRSWEEESGWRQQAMASDREVYHRLYLGRNLSEALKRAGSGLMRMMGVEAAREEASIAAHCVYSPVAVVVDGQKAEPLPFGRARYPGYDISQDPNPGECRPPPYLATEELVDGLLHPKHHLLEWCLADDSGLPASLPVPTTEATLRRGLMPGAEGRCRAWLAVTAELKSESEIAYVEDGVLLCRRQLELPCPGLSVVFSAEALDKDLTGFQLVENEVYRAHLDWLRKRALEMRAILEESLALFPIRERVRESLSS